LKLRRFFRIDYLPIFWDDKIELMMTEEISVLSEEKYQLIDITEKVEEAVQKSGVKDGLALIFAPHSTAAVLITENERGLRDDWLNFVKRLVFSSAPKPISSSDFKHNQIDDNADSHLLSGLIGQGRVLPVGGGQIRRGSWQQIFLLELDGPRKRKIIVKVIEA
jgi:secondary thiamine-phosphate synthase enzyme